MSSPTAQDIAAQVAAGQIERAIAIATTALANKSQSANQRMTLLEQRCECYLMRMDLCSER